MTNKKQKYNLGDEVYFFKINEDYSIHKGKVIGVRYSELPNCFYYNIAYSFFYDKKIAKDISEEDIFTNEEDAKKYAYLRFVEICNDINDVINGRARFVYNSLLKDYMEHLQDLNKTFGFQLQIYPYECKKDLKKEIKRLKKEIEVTDYVK